MIQRGRGRYRYQQQYIHQFPTCGPAQAWHWKPILADKVKAEKFAEGWNVFEE